MMEGMISKDDGPVEELLAEYPHSFQLKNQDNMDSSLLTRVARSVENALKAGYKTSIETARARNLLAFLYHKLGRSQDSLTLLRQVLSSADQQDNLVTMANSIVILYSEAEYTETEEPLAKLKSLKAESQAAFANLLLKAKAEMAFSYSRFGPSFFDLAIETFDQLIPTASGPDVWLWKFGCALTRRRKLLLLHNSANMVPLEESLPDAKEILSQYLAIINNVECPTFRARVFAEIALLLDSMWKSGKAVTEIGDVIERLTPLKACEAALSMDNNDRSVLTKCSRVFRNAGKTEESVGLLRKALSQRPSATGYHHLGLALMCLASERKAKHGQHDTPVSHVNAKGIQCLASENITTFSRDDTLALEAYDNLKLAVEITEGHNTRAILDLAFIQRCFGELEDSRKTVLQLRGKETYTNILDKITMSDQLASIMLQMASSEKDENRKKRLQADACEAQRQTLKLASRDLASYPRFKDKISDLWQSFADLMDDGEKSSGKPVDKMMAKSCLLQITGQYKQSLGILKEIKQTDFDKRKDPEFLKLYIRGLVSMEQYTKALRVFSDLNSYHSETKSVNKFFGDDQFYLKTQIKAARQALLNGTSDSKVLFQSVFKEKRTFAGNCSENGNIQTGHLFTPDLTLINDVSTQTEAGTLAKILRRECGLQVFLEEDVPCNRIEVNYMSDMVVSGSMVAVLADTRVEEPNIPFTIYLGIAAAKQSTVTLLVGNGQVPNVLSGHRSAAFPSELLEIADNVEEDEPTSKRKPMNELQANALCKLFCFLINIDVESL